MVFYAMKQFHCQHVIRSTFNLNKNAIKRMICDIYLILDDCSYIYGWFFGQCVTFWWPFIEFLHTLQQGATLSCFLATRICLRKQYFNYTIKERVSWWNNLHHTWISSKVSAHLCNLDYLVERLQQSCLLFWLFLWWLHFLFASLALYSSAKESSRLILLGCFYFLSFFMMAESITWYISSTYTGM